MEQDRICFYCNYYFSGTEDFETGLGVCLRDELFEPFIEGIMESSSFACCYDLYLEKRFDGGKAACSDFEEAEIIEIFDEDDINGILMRETLKSQNVDGIVKQLDSSDSAKFEKAVTSLSAYIVMGNNNAYEGLLNYYNELPSADSLQDVHIRVKVVNALAQKDPEIRTISAFINELSRTPSNNTTRQLYTEILNILGRCPVEMVKEPLLQLLEKRQYSFRMKKKIDELLYLNNFETF
ncbi:MAG: hypothetical protein Q7J85_11060 [Bacillota bacterium]|nr:hypothetical protein [Bacillota bacterium]